MSTELQEMMQSLDEVYDDYMKEVTHYRRHQEFVNVMGFVIFFTVMEPYISLFLIMWKTFEQGPKMTF